MNNVSPSELDRLRRRIRAWVLFFIIGLVLSGITAFPLVPEVALLTHWFHADGPAAAQTNAFAAWLATVHEGIDAAANRYPFLFYGTDWLAFGHIVIALFFVGLLIDPVRNIWVLRAGRIACALVWPLALICGPLRGIPFWWRLIDCSFGVLGLIPLTLALSDIRRLEARISSANDMPV